MTIRFCLSLLIGCLSLAQEPTAGLARAALLAETQTELPAALKLYQELAADPKAEVADAFHAELGVIRCLRRLGRTEEARAVLGRLESRKDLSGDGRELLETEKARLASTTSQEDPVRAQVLQALRDHTRPIFPGNVPPGHPGTNPASLTAKLHIIGRPALPVLRDILLGREPEFSFGGGPQTVQASAFRSVIEFMLPLAGDESANILKEAVLARTFDDRNGLIQLIGAFADRNGDRRYDGVVQSAAADPDPRTRISVCQVLRTQPSVPWPAWERLLNDEDSQVAIEAIRHSTTGVAPSTGWPLHETLENLAQHPDPIVRSRVAQSLETVHQRNPIDAMRILAIHMRDDSAAVVMDALHSASRWRSPEVRGLLLKALSSPHGRIRAQALNQLVRPVGQEERERAVELLSDVVPDVRHAARAMLRNEPSAAIAAIPGAMPRLLDLLRGSEQDLAHFALRVLAMTGDRSIGSEIAPLLRSESQQMRALAFYYIRRCDLREYADAVASSLPYQTAGQIVLDQATAFSPNQVAEWLIDVLKEQSIPPIVQALKTLSSGFLQPLARTVASHLSPAHAGQLAVALMTVEDGQVLTNVMPHLRKFLGAHPAARSLYKSQLRNSVVDVRREAASSLEAAGKPEDVDEIVTALMTEADANVLAVLTRAAAKFVGDQHVDFLVETWKSSEDAAVRDRCMAVLAQVSSKVAEDAMLAALMRGGPERDRVIRVVGSNKMEAGLLIIEGLLEEDQLTENEKISAIMSLGVQGRASVAPLLTKIMLEDSELLADEQVSMISNHSEHNPIQVRVHPALLALQVLGEEHVVAGARAIFADPTKTRLMEQALVFLAHAPVPGSDELILAALTNEKPSVQKRAAQVAGSILLRESLPRIRAMLRSSNRDLRSEADRALRRFAEFGMTSN